MTWRLVGATVYLDRRSLISLVIMAGLSSRPTVPEWISGGVVLLLALGAGSTAGDTLSKREMVVLPLSPSQWHRAEWLLSAVLPLGLLVMGRCLGGAWHAAWSDDGWVFHATPVRLMFEVVFFSVVGAWAVRTSDLRAKFDADEAWLAPVAGMVALSVLPFFVVPWLPDRVADVQAAAWIAGMMGLTAGVLPLIWPPNRYRHSHRSAVAPRHPKPGRGSRAFAWRVPVAATPARGVWALWPGLLWRAAGWTTAMLAFLMALQWSRPEPTIWRPFDPSITAVRFVSTLVTPMLLLLGLLPGLAHRAREMKWLPLASLQTAGLLTAAAAVTPLMFWVALAATHVLFAPQAPATLRLDLLTFLIGAVALSDAVRTRWAAVVGRHAVGAVLLIAFMFGMDGDRALLTGFLHHWSLPASGLTCLGLAFLLNRQTVRHGDRTSGAYRVGRIGTPAGAR